MTRYRIREAVDDFGFTHYLTERRLRWLPIWCTCLCRSSTLDEAIEALEEHIATKVRQNQARRKPPVFERETTYGR